MFSTNVDSAFSTNADSALGKAIALTMTATT